MEAVPKAVKWYAALLIISALLLLAGIAARGDLEPLTISMIISWPLFILLIACAGRFPLHVSNKLKVVVDSSLIFAVLLLFPAPWGPLIAGTGILIGHLLFWRVLLDALVNTGVVILEGLIVQGVYLLLGGTIPATFDDSTIILPLVAAMLTVLVVERVLVSIAVALCRGVSLARSFFSTWGDHVKEDAALLLLGILTAVVMQVQAWAIVLTIVPVALVYFSLRNSLRLQVLTWSAVESLADLIDRRDAYTAGHSARVAKLAEQLAVAMHLSWDEIETIRAAARVHDLGKIELDAAVLSKPGALSEKDWELVHRHPEAGAEIVMGFPEFAKGAEYIRAHHERMDGRGYPRGLRQDEIPLGACIIAVADAYDAMTTDRPYRKALSPDVILSTFRQGAGSQWSEPVVTTLFRVLESEGARTGMAYIPATTSA